MAAYIRDPVLAIWQAMKHLTAVRTKTDAPDVSTIVTEAESPIRSSSGLGSAPEWQKSDHDPSVNSSLTSFIAE
jgi:hypothetical protein